MPAETQTVVKFLKNIALLEFIPTKQITGTLAEWASLDADQNIFNEMGLMFIIGITILLAFIVLLIVSYFVINASYKNYRRYRKFKSLLCFNSVLRYILQSNLKMGIAACTSLVMITSTSSAVTSGLILLIIALCPIAFRFILKKNWNQLMNPSTRRVVGSIYLDLRENSTWGLAYSQVFILRRLHFLLLTFALAKYPGL